MKVGFPGQRKRTRRRIDCFYLHEYHDGESKNGAYMMNGKIAVRHAAAASYETETFYAAITDISDSSITVQGMENNDINFRGRFIFPHNGRDLLSVARDEDQPQRPGGG